jgi:hypothetical protein
MITFEQFFKTATRDASHPTGNAPCDYQRQLANDPGCQSRLIEIPSGFSKTTIIARP